MMLQRRPAKSRPPTALVGRMLHHHLHFNCCGHAIPARATRNALTAMEQERDACAVAEVVNIVRIAKEKATILRVMELAIVNSVMVLE